MHDSDGDQGRHDAYFRTNLRLIGLLLAIWAFVSFGCGVLMAPWLNGFKLPFTEYPLGFWFAQQGSIYVFVLLIVVYVIAMNRIDRRFGVEEGGD
ncbi:MAG: hypothetical protein CMJ51_07170 [Planctomycetaceae bacterium]|nr:hypothetical protein [Planctomycetaceae bacterium]